MPETTRVEHAMIAGRLYQGVWLPCPFIARYDARDPYAVTWRFNDGTEWEFARDLLAQGIHEPAGDRTHGNVLFLPLGAAVEVALSGPHSNMALTLQSQALAAFLDATTALVPLGEERIDWDALGGAR